MPTLTKTKMKTRTKTFVATVLSVFATGSVAFGLYMNVNNDGVGTGGYMIPPSQVLHVYKVGGDGIVTSSSTGTVCGIGQNDCDVSLTENSQVTLSATPSNGYIFNGFGDACNGGQSCTLTMNGRKSVSASFTASPITTNSGAATTINKSGNGSGSVTMTANPAAGSTFTGWSGDCSGTGTCISTLDSAKNITANFSLNNNSGGNIQDVTNLRITNNSNGNITIAWNPSAGATKYIVYQTCVAFSPCAYYEFNANNNTSYTFNNVSGEWKFGVKACNASNICSNGVTIIATGTGNGNNGQKQLTVQKNGDGTGKIKSYSGIDCGNTCTKSFDSNTDVFLEAIPDSGSYFVYGSWKQDCNNYESNNYCSVKMDSNRTVTGTFKKHVPCTSVTFDETEIEFNPERDTRSISTHPLPEGCTQDSDAWKSQITSDSWISLVTQCSMSPCPPPSTVTFRASSATETRTGKITIAGKTINVKQWYGLKLPDQAYSSVDYSDQQFINAVTSRLSLAAFENPYIGSYYQRGCVSSSCARPIGMGNAAFGGQYLDWKIGADFDKNSQFDLYAAYQVEDDPGHAYFRVDGLTSQRITELRASGYEYYDETTNTNTVGSWVRVNVDKLYNNPMVGLRWKENVSGNFRENVLSRHDLYPLKDGFKYWLYFIATPHNDTSKYYVWYLEAPIPVGGTP